MSGHNKIRKSIVVSMYNAGPAILEILDKLFFPSLIRQADSSSQIILLNDCSPLRLETQKLVENYLPELRGFGDVKYIENEQNLGFGGSYNKGLRMAEGDVVIPVNDDVYFTLGSLESLAKVALLPGVGVCGPVTDSGYGYQKTQLFKRPKDFSEAELARVDNFALFLKKAMEGRVISNYMLSGFCLAMARNVLKKVGYFDDKRFPFGLWEDVDLVRRIRHAGFEVVVDAQTFIEHGGPYGQSNSILQRPFTATLRFIDNGLRFGKKWHNHVGTWLEFAYRTWQTVTDQGTISAEIREAAKIKNLEIPK